MNDADFMCKHETPDYADHDEPCAAEVGARFVVVDGKNTLVDRALFDAAREAMIRLLPTSGGWCYGNAHTETVAHAERMAADIAERKGPKR